MLWILISAMIIVVGIVLFLKGDFNGTFEMAGVICIAIGIILLLTCVISLPFTRIEYYSKIRQFESTQETIYNARAGKIEIESAAIQLDVLKQNRWLACTKYYNNIFDLWIPDEVLNLEPLK